ncbi:M50 family metallopeptidase [Corallincola platygyrae]|uniref:M50 family metallopeptidase n=1 Tax=Corallincola platygyrae TaxID=1193278 RepID=A0ABW4XRX9_9GAMM
MKLSGRWSLTFSLICAFTIIWLPLIRAPLKYIETLLHEGSHAFAALLSGGNVHAIALHLDGSGLATVSGGWFSLVAFAGYAGASLSAYLLAMLQAKASKNISFRYLYFTIVGVFVLTGIFYTRDIVTFGIMLFIAAVFVALFYWRHLAVCQFMSQVITLFVLLQSAISPSYLLFLGERGDHVALRSHTGVPATLWILVWTALALFLMVRLFMWRWRSNH